MNISQHALPTTMRAVLFRAAGDPRDVLTVSEMAVPVPKAGELLLRVEIRAIQPADLMFIGGRYRIKPQSPQTAGLEGAGVVVAIGGDVSIPTGTRVAFRYPGAWAEYAIVPQNRVYIVPEDICIEDAAQFALNPITAWGLLDELQVQAGQWIGINAPTSVVAQLVHGLARRRNIQVIGLQRPGSTVSLDFPTLPLDATNIVEAVRELTGGSLLAGYLDSVGGAAVTRLMPALQPGSTLVSYGMLERESAQISNSDLIYRNLTWKGFGIDHWLSQQEGAFPKVAAEIWDAIRVGDIRLPVRERYPLERVQDAITDFTATNRRGKILLTT